MNIDATVVVYLAIALLIINLIVLIRVIVLIKDSNDWLIALDRMMAGKSKKAQCIHCGSVYIRDTSHDICPACADFLSNPDYKRFREDVLSKNLSQIPTIMPKED